MTKLQIKYMKELQKKRNKSASENGALGFLLIGMIMVVFFAGVIYLAKNAFGNNNSIIWTQEIYQVVGG